MEWYEQHPPAPIEAVSEEDYHHFMELNLEPSAYAILQINTCNAEIQEVLMNEAKMEEITQMVLSKANRKSMKVAGLDKLKNKKSSDKAINE